jgi:hypothetical protein
MPQGSIMYPGITKAKSAEYTQTLGVRPSSCLIKMIPQLTPIASGGTITFGYNGLTLTLPECQLDSTRLAFNNGFVTSCLILDRRWKWEFAAPINGYYVDRTLRQLVHALLQACGEMAPDVSAVDNTITPRVNWQSVNPTIPLQELCSEYGYAIALGFGSEAVKVVEIGTGALLPTTNLMAGSSEQDPPTRPHWIRVCFGPSLMQARVLLEAVALDTDGVYRSLDTVSYMPYTGWESEPPETLPTVLGESGVTAHELAKRSVYRIYRIVSFPDSTLILPDGSVTLNSISQIFPIQSQMIEQETDSGSVARRASNRMYGIMLNTTRLKAQPPVVGNTDIDDLLDLDFRVEGNRGLVIFNDPVYQIDEYTLGYAPATLFMECSFHVMNNTTNQYESYHKDTLFDAAGFGYATVRQFEDRGEKTMLYGPSHAVTGNINNSVELDTKAAIITAAMSGRYITQASAEAWYNIPMFSIRCDGAIRQLKFIMTDADDDAPGPGCITMVSRNTECDKYVRAYHDAALYVDSMNRHCDRRNASARKARKTRGDD